MKKIYDVKIKDPLSKYPMSWIQLYSKYLDFKIKRNQKILDSFLNNDYGK